MPQAKNRRTTRPARKSVLKRTPRHSAVREPQRGSVSAPAPAIAAASLAALTVKGKSGVDVFTRLYDMKGGDENQILAGLRASFRLAMARWKNFKDFPMLPPGLHGGVGKAINDLVEDFTNRFKDEDSAVLACQDGGEFYFTIYRVCPSTYGWHAFAAKDLLEQVKSAGSEALDNLTRSFLKSFTNKIELPSWYNRGMSVAEEFLEQEIEQAQDELNGTIAEHATGHGSAEEVQAYTERLEEMREGLTSFRSGEAYKAGRDIQKAPSLKPEEMLRRLRYIRKSHPVKEAIRAGCKLMMEGYTLTQFDHFRHVHKHFTDYGSEEELEYYNQFMILWDLDSQITECWEQYINDRADNVGLQPAVFAVQVRKPPRGIKAQRLFDFDSAAGWPMRLEAVMSLLCEASIPPKANSASK